MALEYQVEKLRSLIETFVKTSRLEAGVLALHLGPVLEESVSQFAPKAMEKGIALTLASTDAKVEVLAVFRRRKIGFMLVHEGVVYTLLALKLALLLTLAARPLVGECAFDALLELFFVR